eukprot:1219813-Prymnesium_polylepis.1
MSVAEGDRSATDASGARRIARRTRRACAWGARASAFDVSWWVVRASGMRPTLTVTSVTGSGRWGLEPLTFTVRPGGVRPGVGRLPLSDLAECDFRTRPTFGGYIRYSEGGRGRWGLEPLAFTVRPGGVRPGVGWRGDLATIEYV